MNTDQKDKTQIGLTNEGDASLDFVMQREPKLFPQARDAYRFAICYAIALGFGAEDAPKSGYETKFSASGSLDSDGILSDIVEMMDLETAGRPYATLERLAELGICDIARRLLVDETLTDILEPLLGAMD